jgi:hypothetical protein
MPMREPIVGVSGFQVAHELKDFSTKQSGSNDKVGQKSQGFES